MKEVRITENDGKVIYKLFKSPDCEYVNIIEHDISRFFSMGISILTDAILLENPNIDEEILNDHVVKEVKKSWQEEFKKTSDTKLPVSLHSLFTAKSKKEQKRLLSGISLTSLELRKLLYVASIDHNYLYSQYTSEHDPNNFDPKNLPPLSYLDRNGLQKVGRTSLSDGQLRQAIDHRKVTISKFLDKGDSWHCLFITHESIKGKEKWKNGQAHYHYISNLFGMSRARVLNELKSKDYSLGSLPHINITDYGNQPK